MRRVDYEALSTEALRQLPNATGAEPGLMFGIRAATTIGDPANEKPG